MDKHQAISILISIVALLVSFVTGYFQYQSRQDAVEEKIKMELKMAHQTSPLSPLDLRIISGVDERKDLKAAIMLTNMGSTTVRITEVGYDDYELPQFAFYAGGSDPKVLSPGEQAMFIVPDLIKIDRQLTEHVLLGKEKGAKVFATSTKGKRFESQAIIEVAK
ncbi:hypothetical protein [Ottowia sp. SB7-C50]|uniref:hypothetical protein n=1 Tax=Ottowia sp. SB7-C50 TaxID=3081231 RepID=UPI002952A73E|nr:hypothetical protein [Ottowia sp. SB7-C50]WOP16663.1 hypothetical protein R0D99_06570 [Ottowia sp. SB7-C50]